jgi:uncharacterized SAM-binding protein YcdF (DUF218 family)
MIRNQFKNIQILRLLRNILLAAGVFFSLLLILSFTTVPYRGYHWLGTSCSEFKWKPETILLLGGSGMPSESNLIRIWFTAEAANKFPDSRILIVMPGDTSEENSTPQRIKRELEIRGINTSRILFEAVGTNTRGQALECRKKFPASHSLLLVTSPENMRRTVLTFKKTGFSRVNALPAFENASEADFSFNDNDLGGRPAIIPGVGKSMQIRYQIWNHLKYEILVARELTALVYYRMRGWI